jgi:hypothetical protein
MLQKSDTLCRDFLDIASLMNKLRATLKICKGGTMSDSIRACQNVSVSGERWTNIGAGEMVYHFVLEPYYDRQKLCAESQTEIDAKTKLNKMIAGYCDRSAVLNCDCKKTGEVEVKKIHSFWERLKSLVGW